MKKLLLFFLLATTAFGAEGDRFISNPNQDKDIVIQVNDGGVKKDVVKAVGATGKISFPSGIDSTGAEASLTEPGIVTTGNQEFAGQKSMNIFGTSLAVNQCATLSTNSSIATCGYARQASNQTIEGLTGVKDGQVLFICSTATTTTTLVNDGTGTTKFLSGTGANVTLAGNDCALLVYDVSNARLRVVSVLN